jgi:hypothetical protein
LPNLAEVSLITGGGKASHLPKCCRERARIAESHHQALGSTLRSPGPASGIRLIWTYFDRSLRPLRGAPASRGGTSASVSAAARPVTTVPAMPADAAVRNLLRDTASLPNGPGTLSSLDVMLPSPLLPRRDGQIACRGRSQVSPLLNITSRFSIDICLTLFMP